ncbi:SDR family NAD(P)-dependent oxidoreductase [Prauserella cavernicola]|uniref:SDR family NAD(P)-dependent oxidoreductase n=1 Tax=Prauserella cavernicola TaxID=2800127 RepID=A0A934QM88_9PSEU|nr:SDR family NAD(P)-dependent oxidoreductase [Prauserella cavernicola]MBK1782795.1 SDR family NAD(P)-dependent oxidoreductase [Prauserella cavernicola]
MFGAGTTAVVTGGSSGIGAATAERLAGRGCDVLAVGRDTDALADIARRTGARCCAADLTSPGAADRVLAEAGEVDLLVCNAGVGWSGPLEVMPEERVGDLVRVNLLAPMLLVRAALPGMLARGRGQIVLVSSIAGSMSVAGEAVYSATKAGLDALGASVRGEVAGRGVGVTIVVPGVVDTPFFARRGSPYARRVPRPVPPERVAAALVAAAERNRSQVFVPRWLRLPARLRGVAPTVTDALQRRTT